MVCSNRHSSFLLVAVYVDFCAYLSGGLPAGAAGGGRPDADAARPAHVVRVSFRRKERIVPFGEGLASSIEAWRHLRTSIFGLTESFLVNTEGRTMTPEAVYAVAHEALSAVPNLARRGAHVLRHTFATDMLNSGADLMLLKER